MSNFWLNQNIYLKNYGLSDEQIWNCGVSKSIVFSHAFWYETSLNCGFLLFLGNMKIEKKENWEARSMKT